MEGKRIGQRDATEDGADFTSIERDEPLIDSADGPTEDREEVVNCCVSNRKTKTLIFLAFALLLLLGVAFGFVDAEAFERVKPLLIALANKETRIDTLLWLKE